MSKIAINECKKFIEEASNIMNENKNFLIDLDAKMGDGDLGLTMSQGFGKAKEFLETYQEADIGRFFFMVGMTISKAVPSTMGTLIASAFMRSGKELNGKIEMSAAEFELFTKGFVHGIMDRGKAKPGDRTIVDSIYPAYESSKKDAELGLPLHIAVANAYAASHEGLEATKTMVPTIGKAFYHQKEAEGVQDQGATVGMLVYQAWNNIINN